MFKRVYSARVKDTAKTNPKWDGGWRQIKTLTNPRGQWSTRKGAQAALDSALSHDDSLIGHVFTQRTESKPTLDTVVIEDWLYGNVVPINEVPIEHRAAYKNTLERAALAGSRYGHRVYVSSSFRTLAQQKERYAVYLAGGPLAAVPGTSPHEKGLALDIPNVRGNKSLLRELKKVGLIDSVPSEKWHVQRS